MAGDHDCRRSSASTSLATIHQPLAHNAALAIVADRLGNIDRGLQEELAHCGVLTVRLDREVEVWVGMDQRSRPSASATSTKVLIVLEPPDVRQFNTDGFDLVLTWQEKHLLELASARLFIPSTPWLVPAEWPRFHGAAKSCGLGFLRGTKTATEGHRLRHEVWEARDELASRMRVPARFSAGGVCRDERNSQFLHHFVLVVENSRHKNYFTEKLLDAVLCRCVPVYWGCTNIQDFFDPAGIIEVGGGSAEVLAACRGLTEDDYFSRADVLDRNFEAATQYVGDFGRRVQNEIKKHLAEMPAAR
eukprot:CAMPEP_0117537090 /NCGR_PEP_ID=MMETSP0784-20121206/41787_1 /TAXON_ID=39447 /ORGANISM="" /LENGTH=303 /DNA_ID=CAMNT_0005333669 /DNA_START=89 /DNA_END=996 /DNA_ORIENTATION=+